MPTFGPRMIRTRPIFEERRAVACAGSAPSSARALPALRSRALLPGLLLTRP